MFTNPENHSYPTIYTRHKFLLFYSVSKHVTTLHSRFAVRLFHTANIFPSDTQTGRVTMVFKRYENNKNRRIGDISTREKEFKD